MDKQKKQHRNRFREYLTAVRSVEQAKRLVTVQAGWTLLLEATDLNSHFATLMDTDYKANFSSYLRNDREMPFEIAKEVKNYYNANSLKAYLEEICSDQFGVVVEAKKQELSDAFKKYDLLFPTEQAEKQINDNGHPTKPNNTVDTAIEYAVWEFEQMLQHILSNTSRTNSVSTPRLNLLITDKNSVATILLELLQILDEMIEWSASADAMRFPIAVKRNIVIKSEDEPGIVDKVFGTNPNERVEFLLPYELDRQFKTFTSKLQHLKMYGKRYSDWKQLHELLEMGSSLKARDFLPDKDRENSRSYSEAVDQYYTFLERFSSEIITM